MSVSPEQVEAHAAQGYSLLDVARLLGVTKDEVRGEKVIDAYNEGARRWKENGASPPPKVIDLVGQAVHAELLCREMTRAELRDSLSFQYSDINLALELLEGEGMIDKEEDNTKTYFRSRGIRSPVAERKRSAWAVVVVPPPVIANLSPQSNGNELSQPAAKPNGNEHLTRTEEKISARNPEEKAPPPPEPDEPDNITATTLGVSIANSVRAYVNEVAVGTEVTVQTCYDWIVTRSPEVETITTKKSFTISIRLALQQSKSLEIVKTLLNKNASLGARIFCAARSRR